MEYFREFEIQSKVKNHFAKSLKNNRLAHAYLFYGPEGCGKEAFAIELSKAINCLNESRRPCYECSVCMKVTHFNHPDIKYIFPLAKDIKSEEIRKQLDLKVQNPFSRLENIKQANILIEQIKELKNESIYLPYEARKKVYIISDADKMTREAANSFLKLLEEPPDDLMIILTTTSQNAIPLTIRSRCHIIHFPVLSFEEARSIVNKYQVMDDSLEKVIRVNEFNLKKIFDSFNEDIEKKTKQVYEYLRSLASGDALRLKNSVDQITQSRDRNYLMDILNLLILWFKDVIHLISLDKTANLVNMQEEIKKFAALYRHSDFDKILRIIEEANFNIKRNVNGALVLTVLGIRIKETLIKME